MAPSYIYEQQKINNFITELQHMFRGLVKQSKNNFQLIPGGEKIQNCAWNILPIVVNNGIWHRSMKEKKEEKEEEKNHPFAPIF